MSERYVKLPSGLLLPAFPRNQVPENFKVHHKGVGQTFANDCARYCLIRMSDEREYKLSEPTKEAKEWLAERDHAKRKLIEERPGFDGLAVPAGTPRVWQAFAATDTNRPIVQFNASWQVPRFTAIPTDHGQTLTYWNGISPSLGGSPLLQPVMQWGPSGTSGAGTVSGFGVACWYVVDNGWFVSPLVSVSPSDSLVGSITKHGKPPSDLAARILSGTIDWYVAMAVNGSAAVTSLPVSGISSWDFCHADIVLENWDLTTCADNLQAPVTITNQCIADAVGCASVNWQFYNFGTACSYYATNNSLSNPGGSVTLGY